MNTEKVSGSYNNLLPPSADSNKLPKGARLYRKKLIDTLFDKTSPSFANYPLRIIYRIVHEEHETLQSEPVSVLFSVSKKHFKRAVKRNRVKRQLREAYRLQKKELYHTALQNDIKLTIAFLWLSKDLMDSRQIEVKMEQLLSRLIEKIVHTHEATS